MRVRAWGVVVLLLAQWGCGVPDQEEVSVLISGQLADTPEGAARRYVFSSDAPPKFSVDKMMDAELLVQSKRNPNPSIRVRTSTIPVAAPFFGTDLGDDVLTVTTNGVRQTFFVRWAPSSERSVFGLVQLAASPIHNEALWGIDALALAAYHRQDRRTAAQLWSSFDDSALAHAALSRATSRLRLSVFLDNLAGRYTGLEARLDHAHTYALEMGDQIGLAREHSLRAQVQKRQGQHLLALKTARQGYQIARDAGAAPEARGLLQAQALCFANLGRFSEAIDVMSTCVPPKDAKWRERARHASNVAWLNALAMLNGDRPRHLPKILKLYAVALERYGQDNPPEYNNVRARMAYFKHKFAGSDVGTEIEALLALPEDKLGGGRIFVRILAIEHALKHGEYSTAVRRAQATVQMLREEFDDSLNLDLATAQGLLAEALAKSGQTAAARPHFEETMQRLQVIARSLAVPRTRAQFIHRRRRAVISYAQLLIEEQQLEQAFLLLAQARSVLINELEQQVRVQQDSEAWSTYAEARSHYEDLRQQGCAKWVQPASKARCEADIKQAEQTTEARLQAFYQPLNELDSTKPLDLARLKKVSEQAAIALVSGTEDTPWVIVLYRGQLKLHRGDSAVDGALKTTASAPHVFIVPSDLSGGPSVFIPAVSAGRSASLLPNLGALLRTTDTAAGPPLVVADADGSLPHALAEARSAAVVVNSVAITGEAAQREDIVKKIKTAAVFHFSGHTESPLAGRGLGLQMSEGEQLTIEDLLIVRPKPELVVLAACQSGSIRDGAQDTLPAVFLQTGAKTVLATLRPIPDGASAMFISAFYAAGGVSDPVRGFAQAVTEARARGDDTWKAFRLWGGAAFDASGDPY